MVSAMLMFRRVAHGLRYAVREEDFVTVTSLRCSARA